MITVIIATLNRPRLLERLLDSLVIQTVTTRIIIVDASDPEKRIDLKKYSKFNLEITYLASKIKSAAIQRNMALDILSERTKYVAILDDDVSFDRNYLEIMIKQLEREDGIGISGLAINIIQNRKLNKFKLLKSLFYLYSSVPGSITAAGINIPVIPGVSKGIIKTEWLIGCSVWRYSIIKNIRYQKNFLGQSLFEDVIFSMQASKFGSLLVDTEVFILHAQSEIERPNEKEFYSMWVSNRYQVIKNMPKGLWKYLAFHWANLGKLLQFIFEIFGLRLHSTRKVIGLIHGYLRIMRRK